MKKLMPNAQTIVSPCSRCGTAPQSSAARFGRKMRRHSTPGIVDDNNPVHAPSQTSLSQMMRQGVKCAPPLLVYRRQSESQNLTIRWRSTASGKRP
jgi:hypothetical protein